MAPEDRSSDITQALTEYSLNEPRTQGAPQQQVVDEWVAEDLLTIIAEQQNEAASDERLPALAGLLVLGLALRASTSPRRSSLLVAFRSVLIPLKAALLDLGSVGAAYGVVVAVFQWGWGSSLIGIDGKLPIPAFVPMLVFAIVFGPSMDYEVFLISRAHEAWTATGDAHRSVAIGIGGTGRVITTAAAIMITVFSSSVLDTDPTVTMLAIGMAAAVLIDASVIRMVLVPAVMSLFDRRAWWLPRWLDGVLPHLDSEGTRHRARAASSSGPSAPAEDRETSLAGRRQADHVRWGDLGEWSTVPAMSARRRRSAPEDAGRA
ncbi:MMPL family transporter [Geodermatophilus sp. URMC 62]|uniref:MMPL family transporter n=1 Tax=Geodermatophilus sp. URMC 62 TaxID=3423414 RepID=UPI00406C9556